VWLIICSSSSLTFMTLAPAIRSWRIWSMLWQYGKIMPTQLPSFLQYFSTVCILFDSKTIVTLYSVTCFIHQPVFLPTGFPSFSNTFLVESFSQHRHVAMHFCMQPTHSGLVMTSLPYGFNGSTALNAFDSPFPR